MNDIYGGNSSIIHRYAIYRSQIYTESTIVPFLVGIFLMFASTRPRFPAYSGFVSSSLLLL